MLAVIVVVLVDVVWLFLLDPIVLRIGRCFACSRAWLAHGGNGFSQARHRFRGNPRKRSTARVDRIPFGWRRREISNAARSPHG